MRLGVHIPHLNLKEIVAKAISLHCKTIQRWIRNPKSWQEPPHHLRGRDRTF